MAELTNEDLYTSLRADLYAHHPMAAFGPAHACLDDENWDLYQGAIDACHLILAYRGLSALGLPTVAVMGLERFETVYALDFYADHDTEEIAATLATLELIREQESFSRDATPADNPTYQRG